MMKLGEETLEAYLGHQIKNIDVIIIVQEDLTSQILAENLSPSRAPILGSPRPLAASGALMGGSGALMGASAALMGASGALDLSSSSFAGSALATLKREVSTTEDKKFGQVTVETD